MQNAFSLRGKTALITGGGTGIGFGVASAFIESGSKVVLIGRRRHILQSATERLGKNAFFHVFDVNEREQMSSLIELLEREHGPIHILVNNAGRHLKKWAQDTTDEEFEEVLKTNLISVFSLTRAVAANMLKRKNGCILMISSMTALFGMEKVVAYSVSKTGLTGMINTLVTEYSKNNVRVNAIAPGWIESDIFFNAIAADEARRNKISNRIAMDGFGKPEDVGYAAVYLCSDAAKYVTGVVLPVDGGALVNM